MVSQFTLQIFNLRDMQDLSSPHKKNLCYKSFSQIDNINTRYHLFQNFQTIFYMESFLRIFFSLKQISLSGLFQLRSQFFA